MTVEMVLAYNIEGDYRHFAEVDFFYPSELNNDNQDLPLLPKKLVIQSDGLSKYYPEFKQKRMIFAIFCHLSFNCSFM